MGLLRYKAWFDSEASRYSYTCTKARAQAHRDLRVDTHIKRINIGGKVRVNFIITNRLETAEPPQMKQEDSVKPKHLI